MLAGPPVTGAEDWHGILAGVFAAMAMGAQSVVVRLLMRGIPQTNVMTGNMTQLGIETTELIRAWRRRARDPATRLTCASFSPCVRGSRWFCRSPSDLFSAPLAARRLSPKTGLTGVPLAVLLVGALTCGRSGASRVDRAVHAGAMSPEIVD